MQVYIKLTNRNYKIHYELLLYYINHFFHLIENAQGFEEV
ncbi:MAG: hypothetical protein K0S67_1481 [Nitrososphaeraceae archaeon]|jgi:hypothetical protein|nr:hypothetical protein [Nitrososphaeraceae archaeon]MCD6037593.1 hypothetical protein [Nitrososphaeraceae archaeon]MDF2768746.1 hypothetical protein [Nitrososphaeraceae archaeon]